MKTIKIIFALMLFGLTACEPPVTFTEPQPTEENDLNEFPKKLQGEYMDTSDNTKLNITSNMMIVSSEGNIIYNKGNLDSTLKLVGDTLIDMGINEKTVVTIQGDSIIQNLHYTDTLFAINQDHILRKYKGRYFLNIKFDKESWEVKMLTLEKGKLKLSSISVQEDLKKLQDITEQTQDTLIPYTFEPTKKQFKKFIKRNGFSADQEYIKLGK